MTNASRLRSFRLIGLLAATIRLEHIAMDDGITGDPARWPHLEAAYQLAQRAATGFAPPPAQEAAFTAARWGLLMGLALSRLDPVLAEAVWADLESHDRARDGEKATLFARQLMLRDVLRLARQARRTSGQGGD